MTPQEAITFLKETIAGCKFTKDKQLREVCKKSISALEKQIPKKPRHNPKKDDIITTNYECPDCSCRRLGHTSNKAFCPECGQALDWSDNNETY